ncbi:MAG: GIY-YIG nuclease family protein [Candidatus Marinimicrobia bacterium]|nr:GIY-YIG nuclease family protein [Candidatus Neomarinimicrobiota bacterium]
MKNTIQTLPEKPGVYFFKNAEGIVLYVGKAKSLKKRVSSYFQKKDSDWKIKALLEEATTIDYVITNTEHEALLLEVQLIQNHDPKYNILLKSGNPYIYLSISGKSFPELKITRTKKERGTYFGPFIHKQDARRVHNFLLATFGLHKCNKTIENGCLDFHLGKCSGTCMSTFDKESYLFKLELAHDVLKKDHKGFLAKLMSKIKEHSEALEFEKAKQLHEYKENIEVIFKTLHAKFTPKKYAASATSAALTPTTNNNYYEIAQELKEVFALPGLPLSIDCFDISHFQSKYIVGSCVRFTNGLPDKNQFRRFKIKTITQQNDYAALQEIVMRRYKDDKDLPDLVLIDGGKGQLNAVLPLLKTTPCMSLAKREETIFSDSHPEGLKLSLQTEYGKLLIALRDYTHHFAISYHKLLRSKNNHT